MDQLRSLGCEPRPSAAQTRRIGFTGLVSFLLLPLMSVGCGHPATEAECRVILERIVDLELKGQRVIDPTEIARRRSESLGLGGDAGKSDLLEGCIGRHITDRALACVRAAETATDITEHCLQ